MLQATPHDTSRIRFLDGMRGLAILLVIGYHAYARYPDLMPFGSRFLHFPPFHYGWVGVQLFFLISGFVIFLTLEKTRGFADFMTRRWMRLFPAMLVCSLVVYVTFTWLMPEARPVSLRAMLPGLSFIDPHAWSTWLGSPQPLLEGSFWSLFVEVRFYAFAGALFFLFGETVAIGGIIVMFLLAAAPGVLQQLMPGHAFALLEDFRQWTLAEYFGWFAAGALYFRFFQTRATRLFVLGSIMAILSALVTGRGNASATLVALLVAVFFAAAIYWRGLHPLLESRVLQFVGFISYPLYLVHESIMVQLTLKLGKALPQIPGLLLPLLPILFVVGLGSLITLYGEPWMSRLIRPWYLRARLALHIDRKPADAQRLVEPMHAVPGKGAGR